MSDSVSLSFANNETWIESFQFTLDQAQPTPTPRRLNGSDLWMQVRDADGNLTLDCSTPNGLLIITDADGGHWQMNVPVSKTADIPPGTYTADVLELIKNDPRRFNRLSLSITVSDGVTKGTGPSA